MATARDDVAQPGVHRLAAELTTLALRRLDAGRGRRAGRGVPPGGAFTERQLHELVVRSDGLPFLVEELLGARPRQLPPSLAALVADRLAALPSTSRRLVVAAAVAGGDPDWRLVAAMTALAGGTPTSATRHDATPPGRTPTDTTPTADTAGPDTAGRDLDLLRHRSARAPICATPDEPTDAEAAALDRACARPLTSGCSSSRTDGCAGGTR